MFRASRANHGKTFSRHHPQIARSTSSGCLDANLIANSDFGMIVRFSRSGALLTVFCSALQTIEPQTWHSPKGAGKHAKDGSAVSDAVGNLCLVVGK